MSQETKEFEDRIRAIYKAGCDGILPSESPLQLILDILSAVRDGKVKIPGEMGRSPVIGALGPGWVKIEEHLWRKVKDGGYFIALSPTGTGKEEEKDVWRDK